MPNRQIVRFNRRREIAGALCNLISFEAMISAIRILSPELRLTLKLDLEEMLHLDNVDAEYTCYSFLCQKEKRTLYNLMAKEGY